MEQPEKNGSAISYRYKITDPVKGKAFADRILCSVADVAQWSLQTIRFAISQAREYVRCQKSGKKIESAFELVRRGGTQEAGVSKVWSVSSAVRLYLVCENMTTVGSRLG